MKEVIMENLIKGKEYWMECFTNNDERQFVSHKPPYKMIATFDKCFITENNFKVARFTNFRKIKFKSDKDNGYTVTLDNYYWKYYETVKNKVQDDMESRACNMILQKVIKDEYYKY